MLILVTIDGAANATTSIDFADIHKQARFANAAYFPESTVRDFLEPQGYTVTRYQVDPDMRVSFFLATNRPAGTQVVSVRGTSNFENAMVDLLVKLRADQDTGIKLHEGFTLAARRLYAELKPFLKSDYEIRTTGHSLGAR